MALNGDPFAIPSLNDVLNLQAFETMQRIMQLQALASHIPLDKFGLANPTTFLDAKSAVEEKKESKKAENNLHQAYSKFFKNSNMNPLSMDPIFAKTHTSLNNTKPDLGKYDKVLKKQKLNEDIPNSMAQLQTLNSGTSFSNSSKEKIRPIANNFMVINNFQNKIVNKNYQLPANLPKTDENKTKTEINLINNEQNLFIPKLFQINEIKELTSHIDNLNSLTMKDDEYLKQASQYGSPIYGDKVKDILSMKFDEQTQGVIYLVKWRRRKPENKRPLPSYLKKDQLIKIAPKVYKKFNDKLPANQ
jgi:hypothetical protein